MLVQAMTEALCLGEDTAAAVRERIKDAELAEAQVRKHGATSCAP